MTKVISNKRVFISFLISLSFLIPVTGWSSPISIGGTVLEIPNPPGFAAVTPQMTTLFRLEQQFVAPSNEHFISYIAESEIPKSLNDELPELGRRFSVQTAKELIGVSVSKSYFSKLKQIMKAQNDELFKKVEKTLPGLLENVNKGITKQFGMDPALSISQVVPLPPHEETDRTLAYSLFAKVGVRDEAGNPTSEVCAGTEVLPVVKTRFLVL